MVITIEAFKWPIELEMKSEFKGIDSRKP